jgi:hypothetical protein
LNQNPSSLALTLLTSKRSASRPTQAGKLRRLLPTSKDSAP